MQEKSDIFANMTLEMIARPFVAKAAAIITAKKLPQSLRQLFYYIFKSHSMGRFDEYRILLF